MKFAKMPEEPELPPATIIPEPEPEPESPATLPSSSPASDDNEADRAEQLSQLQQQVLNCFSLDSVKATPMFLMFKSYLLGHLCQF